MRCGVTDVRKVRIAAGRDADLGQVAAGQAGDLALEQRDRQQRAEELASRGMSAKQIAFITESAYSTVLRDLGRER